MPSIASRRAPRRIARLAALVAATSLLLAACGGTAAPSADVPADPDAPASQPVEQPQAGGSTEVGAYADPALIQGAFAALDAHDSYSYEIAFRAEGTSGHHYGIVRHAPVEARSVDYGGIVHLAIDGEYWSDLGWGELRPADVPFKEHDPALDATSVQNLFDDFVDNADDFVVDGTEEVAGQEAVRLVIDPYIVEQRVEAFGADEAGWTMQVWLSTADGALLKAMYGGPLANLDSFGYPDYTIEVKDLDCSCPLQAPA